ncbi:MAG TPA: hypothetical protein DDY78_27915, partial [Planctomycetales bacterium]|nr:hypothetical protein [Planctomycetales bacterium]
MKQTPRRRLDSKSRAAWRLLFDASPLLEYRHGPDFQFRFPSLPSIMEAGAGADLGERQEIA